MLKHMLIFVYFIIMSKLFGYSSTDILYYDYYLGCFNENNGAGLKDLNFHRTTFNILSSAICISHCQSFGYVYAGTNNQQFIINSSYIIKFKLIFFNFYLEIHAHVITRMVNMVLQQIAFALVLIRMKNVAALVQIEFTKL